MLKVLQRVFDFMDWQLNHPTEPVPGDMLNASFDAQNNKINELMGVLEGVRRADGIVTNDTVSWDSLTPDLRRRIEHLVADAVEKATSAGANLTKTALANESRAIRALQAAEVAVATAKSASESVAEAKNAAISAISSQDVAPVPAVVSPASDTSVGTSEQWAKCSFDWAEYMGNEESHDLNATIPPTTLRMMDITGDHWSSRWWANRAANVFGEMYGLYLGAHPIPPNQGIDGGPLQPGMIYWDTDDGQLYVWDGSSWHPMWAPARSSVSQLNYQAVVNQTVFDLATADINGDSYALTDAEPVHVFVNGVRLTEDKGAADGDYTRATGSTQITLLRPLRAGDMVAFDILMDPSKLQPVMILATKLLPLTGMNGTKVTFNLLKPDSSPATPGNAEDLLVSQDGVVQEPITAYMVDGAAGTITFSTAPTADAHIFITWFAGGDPVSGGGGGGPVAWTDITGKPATFPPTLPIAQSGVTNLVTDLGARLLKAGDTMTGALVLPADPAAALEAATKQYVDARIALSQGPFFVDTCTRANMNLEASPGGVWTLLDGTAGWGVIASNALASNTTDSTGASFRCPDIGNQNHWVEITIPSPLPTNSGPFACCRLTDRNNFVGIRVINSSVEVYKRVGGTLSALTSGGTTVAAGDVIRLECRNDTYTLKKNGVAWNVGLIGNTALNSTRQGFVARSVVMPLATRFATGLCA